MEFKQRHYNIITPPLGTVYIRNIKFVYPTPGTNNLRVLPRVKGVAFTP
jgi:hypothetical protein